VQVRLPRTVRKDSCALKGLDLSIDVLPDDGAAIMDPRFTGSAQVEMATAIVGSS
jgi:hypothetical protein